jgi:hypothetical protein
LSLKKSSRRLYALAREGFLKRKECGPFERLYFSTDKVVAIEQIARRIRKEKLNKEAWQSKSSWPNRLLLIFN